MAQGLIQPHPPPAIQATRRLQMAPCAKRYAQRVPRQLGVAMGACAADPRCAADPHFFSPACFRGRVLARHITSPCRGGATGGKVCRTSRCQCRRRLEVCDGRPHRLHVLWRARSCSTRALLTQPRCRSGTAPHCFGRQGVSSVFRARAHFRGFWYAHENGMVRNVLTLMPMRKLQWFAMS